MTMEDIVVASLTVHCLGHDKQSKFITQTVNILSDHNLHPQVGPMSTTIEGKLSNIFLAINDVRERLHELGVPKVELSLAISSRKDEPLTMASRMAKVENV
jgi:uncharacterized protein (TIGR00106 family)